MGKGKRIKDILSYLQEDVPDTGTDEPVDVNGSAANEPPDEDIADPPEPVTGTALLPEDPLKKKKRALA